MTAQTHTDELTENGILTDHPDITRAEMAEYHGEPKHEDENSVVFADSKGYEFDEFAEAFAEQGVSREEFSNAMHDIANGFEPDDGIAPSFDATSDTAACIL